MNKTLINIKESIENKEAYDLICDFFASSTSISKNEIKLELDRFAFNILFTEINIPSPALHEAITMLYSLTVEQFKEVKEELGPKLKEGIDLDRVYFPLRKKYIKGIKNQATTLYFINKGELMDLDVEDVKDNRVIMARTKDFKWHHLLFTIEKDYLYFEKELN